MKFISSVAACTFLLAIQNPAKAEFGNVSFTEEELFEPIAMLNDVMLDEFEGVRSKPRGSNAAMVLGGNFLVMGSMDSGKAGGIIHFIDLADPRKPKLLGVGGNGDLREAHSMPTARVDGQYVLVLPSTAGIQTWDVSDPVGGPRLLGELGGLVGGGDYDNSVWQTTMAWPYAYVGSTGDGIYVVDITDPTNPTEIKQIRTGDIGIGKIGPVHMAGNYLVASNVNSGTTNVAVIDVSDPMNPLVLGSGKGPGGKKMYSSLVIGDRIYFPGDSGRFFLAKWAVSGVEASVDFIGESSYGGDKGGYCSFQDNFAFCGQSKDGFFKVDVSNEESPEAVGGGSYSEGDPDMDFATVFGNLVFVANDHSPGPQGALMPHQMEPDTTPPTPLEVYPEPGSTQLPSSTKFTAYFSDDIDLTTVSRDNFVVYNVSNQEVLDGVFQRSSLNAITFSPIEPLAADTTYGVLLFPENGLTDIAGNPIAEEVELARVSTGAEVDMASPRYALTQVVPEANPEQPAPSEAVAPMAPMEAPQPDPAIPNQPTAVTTPPTGAGLPDAPQLEAPPLDAPPLDAPPLDAPTLNAPPLDSPSPAQEASASPPPAPGAVAGSGQSAALPGATAAGPADSGGCTLHNSPQRPTWAWGLLLAVGLLLQRRRPGVKTPNLTRHS